MFVEGAKKNDPAPAERHRVTPPERTIAIRAILQTLPHLTVRGISNLMAKITKLQKFGITVLVLSPVIGLLGTVASIYSKIFPRYRGRKNAGIGSVGSLLGKCRSCLRLAVSSRTIAGLILVIFGRSQKLTSPICDRYLLFPLARIRAALTHTSRHSSPHATSSLR
jgi:hypothetical protein